MASSRAFHAVVAGLALASTAPIVTAADVQPGQILRWAGAGVHECRLKDRTWRPRGDACVFPIDLLADQGPLILNRTRSGRHETRTVNVADYPFPVQRLTLPRHMVELSPEDLARVQRENAEITALWDRSGTPRFDLPLQPPLDPLPEGTRFGARRIINGEPRSPHSGRDYKARAGTPLYAAADGVVALVGHHFFGGRSVFIDHGDGLITMYMHMSTVGVDEGQEVRRGQRIGAVGSTGRATGPHLHFGARWHGARIDPDILLGLAPVLDIQ